MKKTLTILLLLMSVSVFSQSTIPIYNNSFFNTSGKVFGWHNAGDSLLMVYTSAVKAFKPFRPGVYTYAGLPSASSCVGCFVFTSDTLRPFYSNGSIWSDFLGAGGGGGVNWYTTDGSFTSARTASLSGNDVSFVWPTRSRSFRFGNSDSAVHLANISLSSEGDSTTEVTNAFYILRSKTGSQDPRAADFAVGKYFISNVSNGTQPEEDVSFGFNLKPSGVQINTAQPAIGRYITYNKFAASHLHLYDRQRYVDSAGNIRDYLFTDVRPDNATISTTETVSSHQWNGVGNSGTFSTYFSIAQNAMSFVGVSPQINLEDTGFTSNISHIIQSGPDLQITPGRFLNLNGSIKSNAISMNAGQVINFAASTASFAPLNIAPGVDHTSSFANGDMWNNGTHLMFRLGGANYQLDQQPNIYNSDGFLTSNRTVTGGSNTLAFTGFTSINMNTGITNINLRPTNLGLGATSGSTSILGILNLAAHANSDADYTWAAGDITTSLSPITANRTLTLPSVNFGQIISIINTNGFNSGFHWNVSGNLVDGAGLALTTLQNGVSYFLQGDAASGNWRIIGQSGGATTPFEGSTASITIAGYSDYIYTGTGTTWTLPALAAGQRKKYTFKNAGSGNLVIAAAGSDNLYNTSSVTTITIAAGSSNTIYGGSAFWYVY